MDDFEYDYEYEEEVFTAGSVQAMEEDVYTVYENCIQPSIASIIPTVCFLIMYNFMFNVLTQLGKIPKLLFHVISVVLGLLLLWNVTDPIRFSIFISYIFSGYVVLRFSHKVCRRFSFSSTTFTMVVMILSLLVCEFSFPYPEAWLQVRGLIMVLVMKIFSLSHDLEQNRTLPTFCEIAGYICCPANCLFGPWMPFAEYCAVMNRPLLKNKNWIFRIILCLLAAGFFLVVSNCWCNYFIPDDGHTFLRAYKMALIFRSSHYFISYLSEMGMVIAGYSDDKAPGRWKYQIVDPFKIEFPTSLMSVVTSWNIPMHIFLKKYIYRKILPHGQFKAIFATYFISSLLHGFNIEIAVVLLSLGIFSYIQMKFQDKLSEDLDACIKIRPCRHQCNHRYKRGDILSIFLIVLFSFFTVIHLAYLGMLMDAIDNPESPSILSKWEELKYFSHLFLFFSYLYCLA